jgi:hypothetical protein
MLYDIDSLIAQVYRMESVATSSQTFNEQDVIEFLNIELQSSVTPIIQSVNEEFAVMSYDLSVMPLPASVRIPSEATGARLRSVQLISAQGFIQNVPRLNPDKLGSVLAWNAGFYIKNNELVSYPVAPTFQGTLRLNYFRRSNMLVAMNTAGRILSIDTISNTVSLDNAPIGAWTTGTKLDAIIGDSPFDFRAQSIVATSALGAVIALPPAVIAELEVGDYLALEGQTPVAQFIPAEATFLLCQLAGARCLQAMGDTEGYKVAAAKAAEMQHHLINLISDRIEGQPKRLVSAGMGKRRSYNFWGAYVR